MLLEAQLSARFDSNYLICLFYFQIFKLLFSVFQPDKQILSIGPVVIKGVQISHIMIDAVPDCQVLEFSPEERSLELLGIRCTGGVGPELVLIPLELLLAPHEHCRCRSAVRPSRSSRRANSICGSFTSS